jgi:hypothetical protein
LTCRHHSWTSSCEFLILYLIQHRLRTLLVAPTHSCDVVLSSLGLLSDRLRKSLRCFLKRLPCNGFVLKSPIILSVGQYSTRILPALANVVSHKKNRMLMCRVHLPLDARPLFSNRIALWLSWYTTLSWTSYPCPSKKFWVHITRGIASLTPTNSASV